MRLVQIQHGSTNLGNSVKRFMNAVSLRVGGICDLRCSVAVSWDVVLSLLSFFGRLCENS
jgi:hypothetical protein